MTISFVRALHFSPELIHCPIFHQPGAASFTIYTSTKEYFRDINRLQRDSIVDAALVGGISGAMSGALISFGSARESQLYVDNFSVLISLHLQRLSSSKSVPLPPFPTHIIQVSLQVRRQLEYAIAQSKGQHLVKPPGTMEAVRDIFRANGVAGLYTGFRLHFGEPRFRVGDRDTP